MDIGRASAEKSFLLAEMAWGILRLGKEAKRL
jgi:hypothetical protein